MGDLATEVKRFVRRRGLFAPGTTVVVGVSGGPDSLCLLHILRRLAPELGIRLHVSHFNHGLRGAEAAADAAFVARLAADWALPYTGGGRDVAEFAAAAGLSLEEAARQARYAFLAEQAMVTGAAAVAVGHTADDQAETVLMHFLRGSGVAGLRGMLPLSPLGGGTGRALGPSVGAGEPHERPWLVRPLLETPRAAVAAYCVEHRLMPRTDSSNADTTIYRNRLRHELLPELARYNPEIKSILAHTASSMAGDYEVLQDALRTAWSAVLRTQATDEVVLDRATWHALPLGLQRMTLRHAVHLLRYTLRDINWEHVERAVWLAREGHAGQSATLAAGLVLAVDYDSLHIAGEGRVRQAMPGAAPQVAASVPLADGRPVALPGGWTAVCRLLPAPGPVPGQPPDRGWTAWFDAAALGPELRLRPRRPGDRFQPAGMGGHSMKLNEYFINEKVPRSLRDGWPLLEGRAGIAWVCGLRVADWAAVRPDSGQLWEVTLAGAP